MVRTAEVGLASSSADGNVRLWNVASGLEHATLKPHPGRTTLLVFHPNGKALVTGGDDNTVKMWLVKFEDDR
jgi:WD40 repeat protein